MNLVFGPEIVSWVNDRLPFADLSNGAGIGVEEDGAIIAGVVFTNYRKIDIEVSLAADSPRWARRGILRAFSAYPFIQLGCRRVTSFVPEWNERARRWNEGFGFTQEGRHPGSFEDGSAAISYGMLRENCRWLARGAP